MIANDKIRAFLGAMTMHHRYRSWEHCYRYFHQSGGTPREIIAADPDRAALVLGFYLASWGMYRGSSFLLQFDYTIHLGWSPLWRHGTSSRSGKPNSDPAKTTKR